MIAYIVRRLLLLIPMAIGLVVVTFGLLLLIPGDPAAVLLGQDATPEAILNLRNALGLNDPWYIRLWDYFAALLHGDIVPEGRRLSPSLNPGATAQVGSTSGVASCPKNGRRVAWDERAGGQIFTDGHEMSGNAGSCALGDHVEPITTSSILRGYGSLLSRPSASVSAVLSAMR
ncbi:hypothetical protein N8A98_03185 [Devosia neptuniae]|uniref:ABC transporter type 1 GsiC-like N-terminal domain-containing protein n=1 Tax=Devosia neptuniae TaxID=191302 RepID=A0ABY6CDA4_9HYPH|nr:hypothetical protein [Devosia neptuniae]UXN70216.1 hypothetical protein N8A98_03185 [Devosia neptuniae]